MQINTNGIIQIWLYIIHGAMLTYSRLANACLLQNLLGKGTKPLIDNKRTHSKDFMANTNNSDQLGQDIQLCFPLHGTNGVTLGETVYKAVWIGKEIISIKILCKKKEVWCSTGQCSFQRYASRDRKERIYSFLKRQCSRM